MFRPWCNVTFYSFVDFKIPSAFKWKLKYKWSEEKLLKQKWWRRRRTVRKEKVLLAYVKASYFKSTKTKLKKKKVAHREWAKVSSWKNVTHIADSVRISMKARTWNFMSIFMRLLCGIPRKRFDLYHQRRHALSLLSIKTESIFLMNFKYKSLSKPHFFLLFIGGNL